MSIIKVFTDNNKHYSVTSNGNVIGMLDYKHWYSAKATITIGEDNYTIVRKGFWGTLHEVRHYDEVILLIKTQWDGGVAIIKPREKHHFYEFKPQGFFTKGYTLTNYKGEELLLITPDFSWKKFISGYNISCNDNFGSNNLEQLIISVSVYYYNTVQTMAMFAATN